MPVSRFGLVLLGVILLPFKSLQYEFEFLYIYFVTTLNHDYKPLQL